MICRSFPPIVAEKAKVLIVGSMPGVRSLEQQEYYAHPRNAFWPILFSVFRETWDGTYEGKCRLIRGHHLALWDVAGQCVREGSLDSDISEVSVNDFDGLFRTHPEIGTVLCNGKTAWSLFCRNRPRETRTVLAMPSTSPAYTLPFDRKLEIWERALMSVCGTQEARERQESRKEPEP